MKQKLTQLLLSFRYPIIGFLIGYMILPSSNLWAQNLAMRDQGAQEASEPFDKALDATPSDLDLPGVQVPTAPSYEMPTQEGQLKAVLLELSDGRTDPKTLSKVSTILRDQLASEEKFSVLSQESTEAFFRANPNLMQRIDLSHPLNRYLDEARQFYAEYQLKEAIGVLSNTIDSYRAANPPMNQQFYLVDAYIQLGDIYAGANKKRDARNTFKEAVRLNPEREITRKEYAPKTLAHFEAAKEEYLSKAKVIKLDVFSNPKKADVYVNGVHQGQTPIRLDRFTSGEHFVLAKKAGYRPMAKKIKIDSNYQRVKLNLEKDESTKQNFPGIMVEDMRNVDEQVRMAAKVGNLLNVDKVVLVSVQEVGYNHKVSARMIDMKYHASHKPKSVEVLDLPKDTRAATQVISQDLVAMADIDLSKNPKKYADSEVIVIGTKKKKSFLKSPILWGLLSVAVAGGATAGILLGTRGGGGGNDSTTVGVSGTTGGTP